MSGRSSRSSNTNDAPRFGQSEFSTADRRGADPSRFAGEGFPHPSKASLIGVAYQILIDFGPLLGGEVLRVKSQEKETPEVHLRGMGIFFT